MQQILDEVVSDAGALPPQEQCQASAPLLTARAPPLSSLTSRYVRYWEGSATSGAFFSILYGIGFDDRTRKRGKAQAGSWPSAVGKWRKGAAS